MGRRRKGEPPAYLRHTSGQAYCFWEGKKRYLGAYGSAKSHEAYEAILKQWRQREGMLTEEPAPNVTVAYLAEYALGLSAQRYDRPEDQQHGDRNGEHASFEQALGPVVELFGAKRAGDFGPRDLKAVRQQWVERGCGRKWINAQVRRIRRAFKWAVADELIPAPVLHALEAVDGLRESEFPEADPPPVADVAWDFLIQVLPFLNRHVRAMVLLQWHTGMRPGEICRMKGAEIAEDGRVQWKGKWFQAEGWVFMPGRHKNKKKGRFLAYVLCPTAQRLLLPWLRDDPGDYLFQPREARAEWCRKVREKRVSKVTPSQLRRGVLHPRRLPGQRYRRDSYMHAVWKACARAFPPPAPLGPEAGESLRAWKRRLTSAQKEAVREWERQHRFSPNQLRHSFLTRVEREHGIESASKMVGHARISTTEIYVARDLQRASEIAAKLG